ncbi:hypothetical protein SDC9_134929 [bioreactor metagenome]|uniref:Uncharacterized protein n=1 Tax=bioreactor metagenome TaxID=1076179 RepID=A0A645DEY7_9ZZZZ
MNRLRIADYLRIDIAVVETNLVRANALRATRKPLWRTVVGMMRFVDEPISLQRVDLLRRGNRVPDAENHIRVDRKRILQKGFYARPLRRDTPNLDKIAKRIDQQRIFRRVNLLLPFDVVVVRAVFRIHIWPFHIEPGHYAACAALARAANPLRARQHCFPVEVVV